MSSRSEPPVILKVRHGMKITKLSDHRSGSAAGMQATARSRPLRWVLLLAATMALSPGQARAIEARGGEVQPDGSVAKALAYTACAAGIALSVTTAQLFIVALTCFRLFADEVEKITG